MRWLRFGILSEIIHNSIEYRYITHDKFASEIRLCNSGILKVYTFITEVDICHRKLSVTLVWTEYTKLGVYFLRFFSKQPPVRVYIYELQLAHNTLICTMSYPDPCELSTTSGTLACASRPVLGWGTTTQGRQPPRGTAHSTAFPSASDSRPGQATPRRLVYMQRARLNTAGKFMLATVRVHMQLTLTY